MTTRFRLVQSKKEKKRIEWSVVVLAKNIPWSQKVMDVYEYTLNILALMLIFVTLQSPPTDENHCSISWLRKCSQLFSLFSSLEFNKNL